MQYRKDVCATGVRFLLAWFLVPLSAAPPTAADVRILATQGSAGAGLTRPQNAFRPTFSTVDEFGDSNALDFASGEYVCTQFPPQDSPERIALSVLDYAYLWLEFRNEPAGAHIIGLQVTADDGHGQVLELSYYVANNVDANGRKRWLGHATPPDYPEWKHNPQFMFALGAAYGIVNEAVNPSPPENWNMYRKYSGQGGMASGVCLLGAVRFAPGLYNVRISGLELASGTHPQVTSCWIYVGGPPPPGGACCLPDGTCRWTLPKDCMGVFHDGEFCEPAPCSAGRGDLNCDGRVDFGDIDPFVLLLVDPVGYSNIYPLCNWHYGDINGDGNVDFGDIDPFVALLSG